MDFFQAIVSGFKKFVTFSGRASRSEFWYWTLFVFLASICLQILDVAVFHVNIDDPRAVYPLNSIFTLVTFLPGLALSIRRLHDVNRSGWWLLIMFTVIGILFPLLFWNCSRGTNGPNRFGPDPLANLPSKTVANP